MDFKIGDAFQLHKKYEHGMYMNAILNITYDDILVFIVRPTRRYPDGIVEIKLSDNCWEIVKLSKMG